MLKPREVIVNIPELHVDQVRAFNLNADARGDVWDQNAGGRFKAIRCGRRWGKSLLGQAWVVSGAIAGEPCAWMAPSYKYVAEAFEEIASMLEPVLDRRSKTEGVIRTTTGGRIDFWTLEDERAGRSRMYKRVFIDEVAFTKNNMLSIWERSIKPTLLDLTGCCIAASNTNGVDVENFLYAVCNDPKHGFIEFHAPSWNNPTVPRRMAGEAVEDWLVRQQAEYDNLRAREHPLVFSQEFEANFVDWSGASLFDPANLLISYDPVTRHAVYHPVPTHCDAVYCIADTSTKTEKQNDGTAVGWFALQSVKSPKLLLLDWEYQQIEGSLLEQALPGWVARGQMWAERCGARAGFLGGWIEDKDSGQVLLQQARRRQLPFKPIPSEITAAGKDGRAISISGYVWRKEVGFAEGCDQVTVYKGVSRNHLFSQVTGYKLADPQAHSRADDLFDMAAYGIAAGLGDGRGW